MNQEPLFDPPVEVEIRKEYEGLITSLRGAKLRKANRKETIRVLKLTGKTDQRTEQELKIAKGDIGQIEKRMAEIRELAPGLGW